MGKVQPIKPDEVLESFNELITKNFHDGQATVKQNEVVNLIHAKMGGEDKMRRHEIFENHWLDVEDVYRKAGWSVEFDKAGFNETYESYFIFKKKRMKS